MHLFLILLGLFGLLILASLFSFIETATVAVSQYKLIIFAKHKPWAKHALTLKNQVEKLLIFSLFGANFFGTLVTTLSTVLIIDVYGSDNQLALSLSAIIITLAIIIIAEATPKIIASKSPVLVLRLIATPLYYLFNIIKPLIWIIDKVIYLITVILKISNNNGTSLDELKAIIEDNSEVSHATHRSILINSLELKKLTIREVVIPLRFVEAIDIADDIEIIKQKLKASRHTRIMVYNENIDNIIGYFHIKELFKINFDDLKLENLTQFLRKSIYINDYKLIVNQLKDSQNSRERVFVVINEYGDTVGICCLEDMLEIVFGDFTTNQLNHVMLKEGEDSYMVDGAVLLRDLYESFGLELDIDGEAMTINGLIMSVLTDIPQAGMCIRVRQWCLEILTAGSFWAKRVKITKIPVTKVVN